MKVVLLARVSTNQQDYDRQIVELTQHCEQMGWEICNVFTNKISGAKKNEDRQELVEILMSQEPVNMLMNLRICDLIWQKGLCRCD